MPEAIERTVLVSDLHMPPDADSATAVRTVVHGYRCPPRPAAARRRAGTWSIAVRPHRDGLRSSCRTSK